MAASESSIPSSRFTSMMLAPFATCCRATVTAPSKSPDKINFENRGDPVMLVRSPTTTKPNSGVMLSGSSPERCSTKSPSEASFRLSSRPKRSEVEGSR